jgi:hypothetical protein
MRSICCVSYCQENYRPLAELTLYENRVEYARKHEFGMVFEIFPDGPPGEHWKTTMRRMSFKKFEVILKAMSLSNADWIWYADADGMVMNMHFDLLAYAESLGEGCIFNTLDSNGPNGGSMLIANNPRSKAFLQMALELQADPSVPYDNEAMDVIAQQSPGTYIKIPQKPINTYDYNLYPGQGNAPFDAAGKPGWYEPGDFFLHWPGRTLEQRITHYTVMKEKVIR